ncbi:MAG: TatD family hydrolase, partial [Motiliproteus sp.]|nr:TatD family hydrolase [Motiliproteus sp.]
MTDSLTPLVDIAVNLTDKAFVKDLEAVLERAQEVRVDHIVVTGTDIEESESAQRLTERHAALYSTAGVHPHYAKDAPGDYLKILRDLISNEKVKAVGETGLDFNRNFSPPDQQVKVFEQHLELACETSMPIFMHQRDAHPRFFEMVKHYRDHLNKGVLHCFTGTKEELYDCLDLDLHIGITGWICDERRGHHLHEFVHKIPSNRLMLETDAPYLLPRDLKPKPKDRRNVPANLPHILEAVARAVG